MVCSSQNHLSDRLVAIELSLFFHLPVFQIFSRTLDKNRNDWHIVKQVKFFKKQLDSFMQKLHCTGHSPLISTKFKNKFLYKTVLFFRWN